MQKNKSEFSESLRMVLALFLICAITAGVVAVINAQTVDRIAENLEGEIRESIEGMFGEGVSYEALENIPADAVAIYRIRLDKGESYCVNLNSSGFGGDVNMLVSIDSDGSIVGVRVVSHAETPGLGSRATEEGFLSGFVGKIFGESVQAIAGATISSNAIQSGIDKAYNILIEAGLFPEVY